MWKSPHSVGNLASATRATDKVVGEFGQTNFSTGTCLTMQPIEKPQVKLREFALFSNLATDQLPGIIEADGRLRQAGALTRRFRTIAVSSSCGIRYAAVSIFIG